MLKHYVISYAAIAIVLLSLAIFVYVANPKRRLNWLYSIFCISIAWWGFWSIPVVLTSDPAIAILWSRITMVGVIFIPTLYLHFSIVFLEGEQRYRSLIRTSYLFSFFFLAADATPLFVQAVAPKFSLRSYTVPGILFHFQMAQFIVMTAFATFLLFKKWRWWLQKGDRFRERQFRYLSLASLLGYLGGIPTYLLVYNIEAPFLNPFGGYTVVLYGVVTAYLILRYQFLDIQIVITRTGLLLGTYLIVLGVPFVLGWWGHDRLEQHFGREWWLVPLILCTILATIGPFAYAYLRRQAEARLLKEQRRYQRTLQLASHGMTQVRNVGKLCNLITRLVSRTVGMTHASLFLWDDTHQSYVLRASHGFKRLSLQSRYALEAGHPLIRWLVEHRRPLTVDDAVQHPDRTLRSELEALEVTLVIPGLMEHRLTGFLALGPKRSGAWYSTDDLHAFSTLANEAAVAIENATSYEELLRVNEQLKAASERLLRQERLAAVGQFAAGMAHEIKNPLSAIKTFAQYLPEKYADPAFREKFFRIVQEEIDRINAILKELSDFAKPAPLQLKPVRLSDLLDDTLSLLSNQCLKQGIEIHNSSDDNGLFISADPQQLKQVLLNLLLNSIEAMDHGGRLEVSTQPKDDKLVLRIADTGSGIAPESLNQVWDPFFTTKERGMGLGMAIVKGVVERHGGSIHLSSAPGKGTTVEVSLPLASA